MVTASVPDSSEKPQHAADGPMVDSDWVRPSKPVKGAHAFSQLSQSRAARRGNVLGLARIR